MNPVGATDNTFMYRVMQKAMQIQGVALINLMDASQKVEKANMAPLGNFGVGGMIDVYV